MEERPRPVWATYDDAAATYEAVSLPHYFLRPAERLVSMLDLAPESAVLDVGSGTGAVARTARQRARLVVACDASVPMLSRARPLVAHAVGARLPDLPFRNDCLTHATASFVLSHLSDPVSSLLEIRRVLRPTGVLGVSSWAVGPSDTEAGRAWSEIAGEFADQAAMTAATEAALPNEKTLASLEGLTAVVTHAGFRVRAGVREAIPVAISISDYLLSRSIGVTARYVRSTLPSDSWERLVSTMRTRMAARFGERLHFRLQANIVIAARG